MTRILEDVLPVGTPWGGPESRRYLSSFASMRMRIEEARGDERELHAEHERTYHLYLAVSGIGVSTVWNERLEPCSHEEVVERFFPDYVDRTMAFAGLRFADVPRDALREDRERTQRRVVAAIDRGWPVLARSTAAEWSVVAGYDRDGEVLIGWDGAHTYWGAPAVAPDGYLESGMFATARWPDALSRLVIPEGRTAPRRDAVAVIAHMAATLAEQREAGYDEELRDRLADERFFGAATRDRLEPLWHYTNGWVGWYAENRCFIGFALGEILPAMEGARGDDEAVGCLARAAGHMSHTHDVCWEAWRTMRVRHRCDLREEEPCRMCGGCLRPPVDEDIEALRGGARRAKLLGYLRIVDANDAAMLRELRECSRPGRQAAGRDGRPPDGQHGIAARSSDAAREEPGP